MVFLCGRFRNKFINLSPSPCKNIRSTSIHQATRKPKHAKLKEIGVKYISQKQLTKPLGLYGKINLDFLINSLGIGEK